jgi:hypothetical protein
MGIAFVGVGATTVGGSAEEQEANARLIAASPDLLSIAGAYVELAESLLSFSNDWPGFPALPDALEFARGVVKRAEAGST